MPNNGYTLLWFRALPKLVRNKKSNLKAEKFGYFSPQQKHIQTVGKNKVELELNIK